MVPRLTLIIAVFIFAYGALAFHLYDIQVTHSRYYMARAESQYVANKLLAANRGSIFFTDKNGNKTSAASTKDLPLIYAVPKAVEDADEAAHSIAPLLGLSVERLKKELAKGDSYHLIARKADIEAADKVRQLELKGIYVESVPERFYPFNEMASQLIGFVAPDDKDEGESGKYGLEEFYEETLSGVPGEVAGNKIVSPKPGEDITLTIDPSIQIEAGRLLAGLVKKWGAKSGTVIVEDPKTGKILAMESLPHFDPNTYSEAEVKDFLNPATQKIYEPGSVFKVLTMAAGIDAGKITPDTKYNDTGVLLLSGKKIQNWDLKAHGTITMTNVIEESLNTGAAFAAKKTGNETFLKYMTAFGFPERTGVDLPGELRGNLRTLTPKAPEIAYASASFGQGVAVTPLHMINAIAALANGGTLMRPYLNAALEPKAIRRVVSESTSKQVAEMMVSAVDKAKVAKVKGYALAGKTGTAQVPDPKHGNYAEGKVVNTYVGFGPVADPRFVILFKLDEPQNAPLAGQTVVPAFRDLAQFILNYYNIPPDRLDN
jgi:cell division protein FtsI/penicillin-binding protein 2